LAKRGEGRFYHKKAFVLKIPLNPPLPKGDSKDYSHLFLRFLPTRFCDEPEKREYPDGRPGGVFST
jgi:hypothetical protein